MQTISGTLRATARRVPHTIAVKFGEFSCTYAELDTEVDRVARVLSGLGLGRGDRLALMANNSARFIVAFYAAIRVGAVVVPVNPASAPPELLHLLTDSGAMVLVYDASVAGTVGTARPDFPITLGHALSLGEGADDRDLMSLAQDVSSDEFDDVPTESDDSLILYTSGTTGKPKGALFDHHRTMWVAVGCALTTGQKADDRFLHVAPLYHAAELCIMLIPGTMMGATHVVMPGFEPAAVLDALETERITMMFGVPTMFQYLLGLGLAERDLSSLRTALFGAAPMPAHAVTALTAALPAIDLMQLCGQTEAGPGGIYSSVQQVRDRPDASGRQPTMFTEAKVVGPDGRDVAPGEVGELLLRGNGIMKGYWNKPEETAATIRDGWLHTGDLTKVDEDGYMTLVDRLKDVIITGGRNVYSVEVESVLATHHDIVDVAVIAKPHETYGESIVAVVTLKDGAQLSLTEVRDFCTDKISHYKIPHEVVVATIPRNPSGKILKHRLRAELLHR